MFSPLTDYKKNVVNISRFGGLNHTPLPALGEWYDLMNLSDKYFPLLAPRRSRERLNIPECEVCLLDSIVKKNNTYVFSEARGIKEVGREDWIYCHSGNLPNIKLIEIGNKIICVGNGVSGYLEFRSNPGTRTVIEDGQERVIALPHWSYKSIGTVCYFNANDNITAANRLNIGFSYATQTDDGNWQVLGGFNKKDPQNTGLGNSGYFLGSDNKFYYYDKDANTSYEVTAPAIAVFLRSGSGNYITDIPEFKEGSYFSLTVGKSLNSSHGTLGGKDENVFNNQLLRVIKSYKYASSDTTNWYTTQKWEHFFLIDYNADFINILKKKNIISRSAAYTGETGTNLGDQQIYPESIEIKRNFPQLTAPISHNNRIWGANNTNNEIKASAQGRIENFDEYRGLVSDSYAVSVGSDGEFTASCVIDDYIFFFKEHSFTMIYGTRPSNYAVLTTEDFIGMSNDKSLQVIARSAYYMGIDGKVYRFNGQTSSEISQAFGDEKYTAVASAHSNSKYFLLVEDKEHNKKILIYNTQTGIWLAENANYYKLLNIKSAAYGLLEISQNGSVVFDDIENPLVINESALEIECLDKWDIPDTEDNSVEWWCESGPIGLESDYYQHISNLYLTFESESGSEISISAKFDNQREWKLLKTVRSKDTQTQNIKIPVERCQFMRLKLSGKGFCKIFRLSYTTEQGGEK